MDNNKIRPLRRAVQNMAGAVENVERELGEVQEMLDQARRRLWNAEHPCPVCPTGVVSSGSICRGCQEKIVAAKEGEDDG